MYCQILMQSNDVKRSMRTLATAPALLGGLLALALLSACTSGSNVNIAFSQPVDSQTADYGIAYVKRTLPTAQQIQKGDLDDLRQRTTFFAPSDLYLLKPASQGSVEVNITSRVSRRARCEGRRCLERWHDDHLFNAQVLQPTRTEEL